MTLHNLLDGFQFFNFLIAYTCLAISCMTIGYIYLNRKSLVKEVKYLEGIVICNMVFSIAYLFEIMCTGMPSITVHNLMVVAIFLEFILPYTMAVILAKLLFAITSKYSVPKWEKLGIDILYGIITLCLVAGTMTRKICYVSPGNEYVRGPLFGPSQTLGFIIIIYILMIIERHKHYLPRKIRISMKLYILSPFLAIIFQLIQDSIYSMLLAFTFTGSFITLFLLQDQLDQNHENEKQLSRMNTQIVLSQLRPHFLYNALSSISVLCTINPKQASEMTDQFAAFLRKNMSDMSDESKSAFHTEFLHLKNYLAIEKLRFEDRLKVIYDIETEDFELPSLILQPLVENSIKHGILPKEEGGTVRIATRETANVFVITIADNGVGFDTKILKAKRPECHIGIDSVKMRLEHISMAKLLVSSQIGRGTNYTIIIPKEPGTDRLDDYIEDDGVGDYAMASDMDYREND